MKNASVVPAGNEIVSRSNQNGCAKSFATGRPSLYWCSAQCIAHVASSASRSSLPPHARFFSSRAKAMAEPAFIAIATLRSNGTLSSSVRKTATAQRSRSPLYSIASTTHPAGQTSSDPSLRGPIR